MPAIKAVGLKSMISSAAGYCCGVFAKQVTSKLIFYMGISVSSMALLQYLGYINVTVNWKKIDADLLHIYAKYKDTEESLSKRYAKKFFTHLVPLTAGFIYWFKFGFTNE